MGSAVAKAENFNLKNIAKGAPQNAFLQRAR